MAIRDAARVVFGMLDSALLCIGAHHPEWRAIKQLGSTSEVAADAAQRCVWLWEAGVAKLHCCIALYGVARPTTVGSTKSKTCVRDVALVVYESRNRIYNLRTNQGWCQGSKF